LAHDQTTVVGRRLTGLDPFDIGGVELIQAYAVSHAAVHDNQVFDELLNHTRGDNGEKRPVYANSADRSQEREAALKEADIRSEICEKGSRNHLLTEDLEQSNRKKSKMRVRVEHVFGAQAQMDGHRVRSIGLKRATVRIGMLKVGIC